MYSPGDCIKFKYNGKEEIGMICSSYQRFDPYSGYNRVYQVSISGKNSLITIDESDVISYYKKECSCGAESTDQPGHSFWCGKGN
jgi:hypothetical protein